MAYAQSTVTITTLVRPGLPTEYHISFTETDVAAASEWSVAGLPRSGRVVLYKADLTAGSGTTIQPKLGRATNPTASTMNYIGQISAAAAFVHDTTVLRYDGLTGSLYGRSTPDSGTNNAVSTEITIIEGQS